MLWSMTIISQITENGAKPEWTSPSEDATFCDSHTKSGRGSRLVASWHAAVNFLVPIGYEDETGFHFGERANWN